MVLFKAFSLKNSANNLIELLALKLFDVIRNYAFPALPKTLTTLCL